MDSTLNLLYQHTCILLTCDGNVLLGRVDNIVDDVCNKSFARRILEDAVQIS